MDGETDVSENGVWAKLGIFLFKARDEQANTKQDSVVLRWEMQPGLTVHGVVKNLLRRR